MRFKALLVLGILFYGSLSLAALDLGIGQTSVASGQNSLALALAFDVSASTSLSIVSTGYQSQVLYQSSYAVSLYKVWSSGDFLVGHIRSGFGGGVFYSLRGFSDTASSEETVSDYGFGPSFMVQWMLGGPFYIKMEGLYGLRDISSHIALNFQDFTSFSFGLRW